ncbi:MAG TPA: Mpo1-like protein [Steroidobacteraceae bacterium]|nr:Mpo1-like protein [Steroidobacteraceae bacterium]
MRSLDTWLTEYGDSHRHPTNELLHVLCVPPIVIAVLGLLWSLPVPAAIRGLTPLANWASLAVLAGLAYYATLSLRLALGMLPLLAIGLGLIAALDRLTVPLWQTSLAIFIVAWIGQFVGHAVEGKRPSFFKDVQFLLIGPLWLLSFVFQKLGLRY